jgi:hypothetical protein
MYKKHLINYGLEKSLIFKLDFWEKSVSKMKQENPTLFYFSEKFEIFF